MRFQKYHSLAYPRSHVKANQRLPSEATYYVIPGGGVATEDACRTWGLRNGVKVTFETYALEN